MAAGSQQRGDREEQSAEERIAELEADVEALREELAVERQRRRQLIQSVDDDPSADAVLIAGEPRFSQIGTWIDDLDDRVSSLEDQFTAAKSELHARCSRLKRRLGRLADRSDVAITDAELMDGDKIQRVLTDGVEAVQEHPNQTGRRAERLLRRLPTWGRQVTDAKGPRYGITGPKAKEQLEDHEDTTLTSTAVRRVFEQIVEWSADSPRVAKTDKRHGHRRLIVRVQEDDD